MEYKETWEKYKERLKTYDYTEEQIEAVKIIRETYEPCEFEQFKELHKQGVVYRTIKLKKPRHLYVSEDGKFYYLSHYYKSYMFIGFFKTEQ